jgi:hypothetical protein
MYVTTVLVGTLAGLAFLAAVLAIVVSSGSVPRDTDDDGGNDDGGGNVRVPPQRPPNAPTGDDPEWWPEFERAFAAYARDHVAPRAPSAPETSTSVTANPAR